MNIEEKLKQAGLTGNGAKIYLELLKRGSVNGSEVAKKVGLDRTMAYQILNNLIEKGLVNYIIKENKKYFSASNPENLLIPIKEKEDFIQQLIPELKIINKIKEIEQVVEVYEGKSGLKILFEEALKSKEFCFFGGTGKSYDILKWGMKRIEKELVRKGIKGKGIVDIKLKNERWTKLKGLEMRYIEKGESQDTSFGIVDNERVTIHCLAQEKPLVIIIKSKFIASTLKNYFEHIWNIAKN